MAVGAPIQKRFRRCAKVRAMTQRHRIETFTLECGFAGENLAWSQQSRLEDFMRGPAQAVIAEVFERACDPDEVWRIDRLELDLGFLRADQSDEDWALRLQNRLEEYLRQLAHTRLGAVTESAGSAAEMKSLVSVETEPTLSVQWDRRLPLLAHELEAFRHYMDEGTLPWSMQKTSDGDLSLWLERLARETGPALLGVLCAEPGDGPGSKRLDQILEYVLPLKALQTLALGRYGGPAADLEWLERQTLFQSLAPGSLERFQRLWRLKALKHPASGEDASALREALDLATLELFGGERRALLARLPRFEAPLSVRTLIEIFSPDSQDLAAEAAARALLDRLENGGKSGLRAADFEKARAQLLHAAGQRAWRSRMAEGWDNAGLAALTAVLGGLAGPREEGPDRIAWLCDAVEEETRLLLAKTSGESVPLRRWLWSSTLDYAARFSGGTLTQDSLRGWWREAWDRLAPEIHWGQGVESRHDEAPNPGAPTVESGAPGLVHELEVQLGELQQQRGPIPRLRLADLLESPEACERWLQSSSEEQRWNLLTAYAPLESEGLRRWSGEQMRSLHARPSGLSPAGRDLAHWRFLMRQVFVEGGGLDGADFAARHASYLARIAPRASAGNESGAGDAGAADDAWADEGSWQDLLAWLKAGNASLPDRILDFEKIRMEAGRRTRRRAWRSRIAEVWDDPNLAALASLLGMPKGSVAPDPETPAWLQAALEQETRILLARAPGDVAQWRRWLWDSTLTYAARRKDLGLDADSLRVHWRKAWDRLWPENLPPGALIPEALFIAAHPIPASSTKPPMASDPDRSGSEAIGEKLALLLRQLQGQVRPSLRLRLADLLESPEACDAWLQASTEEQRRDLLTAYLPRTGEGLRRWSEKRIADAAPSGLSMAEVRSAHWRFLMRHVFISESGADAPAQGPLDRPAETMNGVEIPGAANSFGGVGTSAEAKASDAPRVPDMEKSTGVAGSASAENFGDSAASDTVKRGAAVGATSEPSGVSGVPQVRADAHVLGRQRAVFPPDFSTPDFFFGDQAGQAVLDWLKSGGDFPSTRTLDFTAAQLNLALRSRQRAWRFQIAGTWNDTALTGLTALFGMAAGSLEPVVAGLAWLSPALGGENRRLMEQTSDDASVWRRWLWASTLDLAARRRAWPLEAEVLRTHWRSAWKEFWPERAALPPRELDPGPGSEGTSDASTPSARTGSPVWDPRDGGVHPGLAGELNLLMRRLERDPGPALRLRLADLLESPEACAEWLRSGTENQRWALVTAYLPGDARRLRLWSEERLRSSAIASDGRSPAERGRIHWQFLMRHIFVEGGGIDDRTLDASHAHYLAQVSFPADRALSRTGASIDSVKPMELSGSLPRPAAEAVPTAPSSAMGAVEKTRAGTDADPIWVANAGVVILGAYLPRLFERLGLTQDRQFLDDKAQERAVHCLDFLVRGSTDTPDPGLALFKVLCEVPLLRALRPCESLDEGTRETLHSLLTAVISHWAIIGSTSVDGLRTSFLQRQGRLVCHDDEQGEPWYLRVEPRPFDMLLDRLPWSINPIKQPWMKRMLHVEWR